MLNAIVVLRIHLIELEKVNELCTDFADHYIETLKLKLNSDNIFKSDDDLNDTEENLELNSVDKIDSCSSPFSSNNPNKRFKKSLKNSKPYHHHNKRELESSFDISNETSLSKIKFNMLNLNNNGN